jgi:hypothetical protein
MNDDAKHAAADHGRAPVDGSDVVHFPRSSERPLNLKMPTAGQLLDIQFPERRHLLFPWLREQESCMVYAGTGIGKSMFALSAAIAIVGGGEFLGWKPEARPDGQGWKVAYIDGEMHISDIQERLSLLLSAIPGVDRKLALENLSILSRQHQDAGAEFPLITDNGGADYLAWLRQLKPDLIILDNFSTLGEVVDENAASSFNAIVQFLLGLKTQGVTTMLVHHAGKSGDFRGSSKLAATFETIIKLEKLNEQAEHGTAQFRVCWDKVRAGGPKKSVREVVAKLEHHERFGEPARVTWDYEAGDLPMFDDLKERLQGGEFINLTEIADHCGKSKPMGRTYVDKGVKHGFWTEAEVGRWFSNGKRLRNLGRTQPPSRPDMDWKHDDEPVKF